MGFPSWTDDELPIGGAAPMRHHGPMNTLKPRQIAALVGLFLLVFIGGTATAAAPGEKYTFVLVHGATAGGWEWKTTGKFLTDDGHTVYRATLTGLGEREHLNSPDIDLQTHINDVVNLILYEDLHDVVLTGHSYGGMVITGVMQVTDVAFVPKDKSADERAKVDKSWQRAVSRGWTIRTFPGTHVAMTEDPRGVATLIEKSVQDRNKPAVESQ
jgi:thioesterase domain-containing protein